MAALGIKDRKEATGQPEAPRHRSQGEERIKENEIKSRRTKGGE